MPLKSHQSLSCLISHLREVTRYLLAPLMVCVTHSAQAEPSAEPKTAALQLDALGASSDRALFTLEVSELSVNETKPNGERWDFGFGQVSRPDLTVRVRLNQQLLLKSKRCKNTFSCTLNERSEPFELSAGQALTITVEDQDLKRDDVIDQLTLKLSPEQLAQSRIFKIAGKSVSTLVLTLKRVKP